MRKRKLRVNGNYFNLKTAHYGIDITPVLCPVYILAFVYVHVYINYITMESETSKNRQ